MEARLNIVSAKKLSSVLRVELENFGLLWFRSNWNWSSRKCWANGKTKYTT